jgi:hypothetical protein
VVLGFKLGRQVGRLWKRREEGWWKLWRWRVRLVDIRKGQDRDAERAPLLILNGGG